MWQELTTFFTGITEGWMVVHTTLLGAVFCYWGTVMLGFLDIDILGDFELDGVDDGIDGIAGIFSNAVSFIAMNNVPFTICASLVTLIMWILACFVHNIINAHIESPTVLFLCGLGAFVGTFVIGCWTTRAITYPMRNLFKTHTALKTESLVGKRCVIKTSKVTEKFGEAELTVDDSYLQISVRSKEKGLTKGDEVVIFDYDKEKNIYKIGKLTS